MKTISLALCLLVLCLGAPVSAFAQAASAPALPNVLLDTSYPTSTGATLTVPSGGNLQAALYQASPGDTIVLDAGATYFGNFVLPVKSGASDIVIRSSALASLPPEGTRVAPSNAGAMAKIVTPNASPAIATEPGAHHYRLVGLELGIVQGVAQNYGIVAFGDYGSAQNDLSDVPHHLVIDRCYIHGNATGNARRGVALNSASSAIIDSHIDECHEVGADSQAICGWNGPGPFKIVNNRLEGSGENVLFGGADPSISGLVPSDIEFRRNMLFKPLRWKADDPSYAGTHWSVKNIFELKNAQRVLVEGNTFENNWADAQNGFSILLTVRNQDGSAPWSVVCDVTFRNNVIRHVAGGVNILGRDDQKLSQQSQRLAIVNNLFVDVSSAGRGGTGRLFQLFNNTNAVTIDHNTAINSGTVVFGEGASHTGFVFTNNITAHNEYGVIGSGTGIGMGTLVAYFPGYVFGANALVAGPAQNYPAGNYFPSSYDAVGFVDAATGDYRLAATSPCRGVATDGTDIGADLDAIEAAIAGSGGGSGGGGTPADTTAPVVTGPTIGDVTTSTAMVSWTTDEPADGQVEYGTTMSLGSTTALDSAASTSHSATLSGLAPNTSYYVRVRSRDAAGNLGTSAISVVRTLAMPSDPGVVEAVLWTHRVNCTVQGASLRKTSGRSGKADAKAASSQRLTSGNGYVEFTATSASTERWLGFGRDSATMDPNGIDYCIRLAARGKGTIAERGGRVRSFTYGAGDVFRIAVENGVVKYSRNGVVFHTSQLTAVYPLYANAVLLTLNATIDNVKLFAASTTSLGRS